MRRTKHSETANKRQKTTNGQDFNVVKYVRFWTGNHGEVKGGSFNVALYMRILSIRAQQ